MPSVCDCPFCGQAAAIPEDLDTEAVVQCPHCEYEFPADRALMYAVEAPPEHVAELPPALIPVLASTGTPPAQESASSAGQLAAGAADGDPQSPAAPGVEELGVASPSDTIAECQKPNQTPSEASQTQAVEPETATEPTPTAAEGIDAAAGLPHKDDGEPLSPMAVELAARPEPPQSETETSPQEASGVAVANVESSSASDASAMGTAKPPAPSEEPVSGSPEAAAAAAPAPEQPADGTLPPIDRPMPAWQTRRKRNPVRTAVGVVISGLLGLAVPYGAWLGLAKLGIVGRTKPPAATRNPAPANAKSARPDSTIAPPPQPTELDEWPGLDENRFAVDPKEPKKDAKPSPRAKKGE